MRYKFSLLLFLYFAILSLNAKAITGTFYEFTNSVPWKIDMQNTMPDISGYIPIRYSTVLADYKEDEDRRRWKTEFKKGDYTYLCIIVEPHFAYCKVFKLKPIEDGNYGIFLMNDYRSDHKKEFMLTSIQLELQLEIDADTTNTQIGTLYCEEEFKKISELKDISQLTDDEYIKLLQDMEADARALIKTINPSDKIRCKFWVETNDYLSGFLLSKHLIKLGYSPVFNFRTFFKEKKWQNLFFKAVEKGEINPDIFE